MNCGDDLEHPDQASKTVCMTNLVKFVTLTEGLTDVKVKIILRCNLGKDSSSDMRDFSFSKGENQKRMGSTQVALKRLFRCNATYGILSISKIWIRIRDNLGETSMKEMFKTFYK